MFHYIKASQSIRNIYTELNNGYIQQQWHDSPYKRFIFMDIKPNRYSYNYGSSLNCDRPHLLLRFILTIRKHTLIVNKSIFYQLIRHRQKMEVCEETYQHCPSYICLRVFSLTIVSKRRISNKFINTLFINIISRIIQNSVFAM